MPSEARMDNPGSFRSDLVRFANARRPTDRHVLIGVSHPSDDPARHRVFEIRASYDAARGGWVARVGEQNLNEQRGDWQLVETDDDAPVFPTAAACLGHAVSVIVAAADQEADGWP
jgi:hypothetical protein